MSWPRSPAPRSYHWSRFATLVPFGVFPRLPRFSDSAGDVLDAVCESSCVLLVQDRRGHAELALCFGIGS